MDKILYTAHARVTGGREKGHGRTDDGRLDVELQPPGSGEEGTNPEQLFAVGYAACFESALATVARRERVEPGEVVIDSSVDLGVGDDRAFDVGVTLAVTLPGIEDGEAAVALVDAAHRVCPYSRATRGNIDVRLTANGHPVG